MPETSQATLDSHSDLKKTDGPYWPAIADWAAVPSWLRDNEFILTGHPLPTRSYWRSFRLWRCLHNETVNIYSHFFDTVLAVGTCIAVACSPSSRLNQDASQGDRLAFGLYLTIAATCFGFSSIFHTLRSHSYHVHHFWGRMDILGINLLALGSGASANYYAFYCDLVTQKTYWALISISTVAATYTLITGGHRSPKWRVLRGGIFTLLGVWSILPVLHKISILGWTQAKIELGATYYAAEVIFLILGVFLFVSRIPERFQPGKFDIWGSSHQLFHFCAVLGSGLHVAALLTSFNYQQTQPNC